MTLALRETGFGPRNQDPSNRIFTPGTRILKRGKESLHCSAQETEWQVEKLNCHSVRIGFSCFSAGIIIPAVE